MRATEMTEFIAGGVTLGNVSYNLSEGLDGGGGVQMSVVS